MTKEKSKKESPFAIAAFRVDAILFRDLLKVLNRFNDEVTFFVKHDGINVSEFDCSRVSMARYLILKECFDEYNVLKEGQFTISIPETLKVAFTRVSKNDFMNIEVNGEDKNIVFHQYCRSGVKRRKLTIIDEETEEPPKPKVSFDSTYMVVADELIKDLQDLNKAGFDSVTLISSKDGNLCLKGSSDTSEFLNEYEKGRDLILKHEVMAESKATYGLTHLLEHGVPKEILALCDVVNLSWSTDNPLKITLRANYPIDIEHWIAPRITVE